MQCDLVARSCWRSEGSTSTPRRAPWRSFRTGRFRISRGRVSRGAVDTAVAAAWHDDGIAPNGGCDRELSKGQCAWFRCDVRRPKSVSLVRAVIDLVAEKVLAAAHEQDIAAAMAYPSPTRPGTPGPACPWRRCRCSSGCVRKSVSARGKSDLGGSGLKAGGEILGDGVVTEGWDDIAGWTMGAAVPHPHPVVRSHADQSVETFSWTEVLTALSFLSDLEDRQAGALLVRSKL